ncbi:MAG: glycoside hydrolase family 44 protein [Pseudomonadota bacterium]
MFLDGISITGKAAVADNDPITLRVSTAKTTIDRQVVDPASGTVYRTQVPFPKPINDNIYGINFAPDTLREELAVPVSRWGGNAVERYNYRTSSSNQGLDWFFANNPMELNADSTFEADNQADGTDSIITVPMLGWVSSGRAGSCSYPVELEGSQDDSIFHWVDQNSECGSGYRNGRFLGPVNPARTSVAADENFVAGWVETLVQQHGNAASGGVEYYALGNEPGLWHSTHGDIQASLTTRSDIIDRNIRYATAIKNVDPTAEVLGPVLWGSSSYYVATDELYAGQRPGEVSYFLQDYLQAMAQAERAGGVRLIDRLAVNFYDQRVYDGGTDALRLESTRHLWDSGYAPLDWWVVRDFLYGNGSAVIPRLKSAVKEFYPGTAVALTEYHFGGANTGIGGLTQIDALGIFGREGLDMATLWEPYADYVSTPEAEFSDMPIFWAYRMYRNVDGNGARFGDSSLFAESSDETRVSVYAAQRGASGAITVMVVNKTDASIPLAIDGISGSANAFRYAASQPRTISALGSIPIDASQELPPYSATLLEVQ